MDRVEDTPGLYLLRGTNTPDHNLRRSGDNWVNILLTNDTRRTSKRRKRDIETERGEEKEGTERKGTTSITGNTTGGRPGPGPGV